MGKGKPCALAAGMSIQAISIELHRLQKLESVIAPSPLRLKGRRQRIAKSAFSVT